MKDNICVNLGENIKKYRKLRCLTQEKLADALNMGIKSLSLIETGNCFVSSKTLAKLSSVLNVSPADLLGDLNLSNTDNLYNDALNALEVLKTNPIKLRALSYILDGLL